MFSKEKEIKRGKFLKEYIERMLRIRPWLTGYENNRHRAIGHAMRRGRRRDKKGRGRITI